MHLSFLESWIPMVAGMTSRMSAASSHANATNREDNGEKPTQCKGWWIEITISLCRWHDGLEVLFIELHHHSPHFSRSFRTLWDIWRQVLCKEQLECMHPIISFWLLLLWNGGCLVRIPAQAILPAHAGKIPCTYRIWLIHYKLATCTSHNIANCSSTSPLVSIWLPTCTCAYYIMLYYIHKNMTCSMYMSDSPAPKSTSVVLTIARCFGIWIQLLQPLANEWLLPVACQQVWW